MSDTTTPPVAPSATPSSTPAVESTAPVVETPDTSADTSGQHEPSLNDNIAEALRAIDEPIGDPPVAEDTTAADSQSDTDEDRFNREHELEQGFHKKRDNRIPHKRVTEMVSKAQAKLLKELTGADVPAGTKFEDFVAQQKTALTERTGKAQTYEQQIEAFERNLSDPNVLIPILAELPAYRQIFAALEQQHTTGRRGPDPKADPMPQPDYDLGNGQFTYSVEGLQKRDEWNARQTEARIMQQFEPLIRQRDAVLQEQQAEQMIAAAAPAVTQQLQDAATWPMFTESKEEIYALLKSDPTISLERAYIKVVTPKQIADENKIRAKVLAEMKRIPTSTSAVSNTPTQRPEVDDTDARIAQAIKGL